VAAEANDVIANMQGATASSGGRRSHILLHVFVVATVVSAAASVVGVARLSDAQALVPAHVGALIFFIALLTVGEVHTVKWLKLHDGGEITTSWAFAFSILLLPAPVIGLAAMAFACAVGDLWHRKPAERTLFNVGQTTLSLAAAAAVLTWMGEGPTLLAGGSLGVRWIVSMILAALAMFVINGVLTCTALALHEGTRVTTMLRRGMFLNLVTDGALVSLAPVFVIVADRSMLLLPLAVSVAGLVHYNTRAALASEHEANHDVLTELPNRRAFLSRLEAELHERNTKRRCALVLIDLDEFKDINDRLGHQTGDLVLSEIASRLRAAQKAGYVASRLGGDEFAVLINHFDEVSDVTQWAESLRHELARPCITAGFPLSLTHSIGVALWPDHGKDTTALFQAADLAMYTAKKTRNSIHVYRESEVGTGAGRLDLLAELEDGIGRGELQLWYQPQIDVITGDVVAFEALVRWDHPRFGLVLPDDFMPIAEHTDLMGPITQEVVNIAIRDAMRWRSMYPKVRVAVNTSARNLHDLGFPKLIDTTLRAHQAKPDLLELEITENTVIHQPERTRAVLESLGELGVRLSIDDFGTGYSSLAHLRSLPVNAIKIDRSFVRDIADDLDDQVIVRSILDLAHNLGLETVAEGVETSRAAQLLQKFGCMYMQGYMIARPMPLQEALSWLSRMRRVDTALRDITAEAATLRSTPVAQAV
jgi:diguanylate cyclase (GGDEF)-like protein